jgi:tRNA G26 N,N-dimethylase Trm1
LPETEILNQQSNRRQTRGSKMSEYYCNNCGKQIKPTDTTCPHCGKNLSEVGRRIVATFTETIGISDSVKKELTKKQINAIEKLIRAIKREIAKVEIESVTFNFGVISVTLKKKKREPH